VDEDVLGVIKKHYVNRLLIVSSIDEFLQLYRDAEERFGTSTKNAIIAVEPMVGLTVNGQLNFAQGSDSFFFRGLSHGVPCVLKFPPTEALARHEVNVFQTIPADAAGKQHLVNVTLVSVDAPSHNLSRKAAILMPFFSSTLDSWPTSLSMMDLLSRVAQSIFAALGAFHAVHLVHCDCKPGNIFIDTAGGAFLGDYDAVVPVNTVVQRCTFTFLPQEFLLLKQSNALQATPAVDFAMLACTLARMVQLPLPPSSGFYVTEELLRVANTKLAEATSAAARSVFDTIRRYLMVVQQDPQYRTGQALRSQNETERESAAVAADESSGNVDWSKVSALQETSKDT
jgi:serine/threonine protein kinase